MAKILLILFVAIAAIACDKPKAQQTAASTNSEVKVEILTTFDGITLYRISAENMRDVYVAKEGTRPLSVAWSHTERHGKSTSTYDDLTIPVVR